ncbi:MAG: hypothetical protein CMM47_06100 [Rhodospirillaceae bacterium]|nr:hypothetical protein [Rhodospirillaceae bacterium]
MSLQTMTEETLPARPLSPVAKSDNNQPTWAGASRFGYSVIILFFVVLGGWAALAPLSSGITASGVLEVDTGIKMVQHLEGGLVKEVLVREGDNVKEGDVLMRLDPLLSDAQTLVRQSSIISGLAEQARIRAEISESDSIVLNNELLNAMNSPVLSKIVEAEMRIFDERRESLRKQLSIRNERMAQIRTEIKGLGIRLKTVHDQMALINDELKGIEKLFHDGHVTKSRLLALKRAQTGLLGQRGAIEATIARQNQRLNEQELSLESDFQTRRTGNVQRLKSLDLSISQSRESLGVIQDKRKRVEIRAPASGQIMNLAVKTIGGVTNRSQPLMEIVPDNERMVLRAKVRSKDIEQVKRGATVKVRLMAFNPRLTPPVNGEVVAISPTTIPSKKGPTYKVTIALDPKSLKKSVGEQKLTSGMPASGIIAVGERTLLEYLMTPMTASFEMALREP